MSNSPEMLPLIEAIFNEALALPVGDRQVLVEARCHGDEFLTAEVCSLLEACAAEELLADTRLRQSHVAANAGLVQKRVGAYEIDRLIGRGGMGAVYVAHRVDGNFEQQVAIKLIDLPLATDLFRERFRLERQILAGLNHPLIARLLDGGVTSEGEPFLVMEYVDGSSDPSVLYGQTSLSFRAPRALQERVRSRPVRPSKPGGAPRLEA